jgi:hypothetical protein
MEKKCMQSLDRKPIQREQSDDVGRDNESQGWVNLAQRKHT